MEWVIKHTDGSTSRQNAKPPSPRVGPGAVKKAAARREQLDRDLARQRRERIERGLESLTRNVPRAATGEQVERLHDIAPSPLPEEVGIITDVPGARRRGSTFKKQRRRGVSYASVLLQRRIVNGRPTDDDSGGNVLARDVWKLN